ncbi:glycosyltransferase family 2 protein [Antrihabitans spumae]|uniref:Glycosyltransferase family 2 protein n=1 Tax=Antrihabitans spumae TaxID=3373370 RepID=A0ABW7KMJ7_9NOCA
MSAQKSKKFSFLTTAYKTEAYLGDTIESVLAQTSPDWELVVVDNGMDDAIAAIVQSYASDERIRLVRQENKGYAGGVMAAAEAASGDFFVVLDSDDQVLPGFCRAVAALVDSDPGVDAVGCDAFRFDDDGLDLPIGYYRSTNIKKKPDPKHRLNLTDLVGGYVPYYTAAIRQSVWEEVGGYDRGDQELHESVVIWLRMVDRYDIRVLPQRLARFRLRSDSLTRDPKAVEAFAEELERSFSYAAPSDEEAKAALESTLRTLRYWVLLRRARFALLSGDDVGARLAAREAFAQRRTVRAAMVLAAVNIAPGALRVAHPAKQKITTKLSHAVGRLVSAIKR